MNLNDGALIAFALDGYKISDQKANAGDPTIIYNGFVNRNGGWYIMEQNTTNGTYRYSKGNSGYTTAFAARESGTYDYFYNVFN